MRFVGGHAIAGSVNNYGAFLASDCQYLIHSGQKLGHSTDCVQAVMTIPDIADDDGRVGGVPRFPMFNSLKADVTGGCNRCGFLLSQRQLQR